ncbi:hypothetical protein ACHAXR_003239 [Thalassiosira sp. AJA248-18]
MLTPHFEGEDDRYYRAPSLKPSDDDSKQEGSLGKFQAGYVTFGEQADKSGEEISVEDAHTELLAVSHSFDVNESIDEFTEVSDEIALASISESEHSSEAAAVSVGEVTEVSDDGILRDDEGNPIDPNEAEENMLRDDEGNIIDPKSLVLRDSFVDISCEPDEFYDVSGENIDWQNLIACIYESGPRAITDDNIPREGEVDIGFRVVPLQESFPSHCYNRAPRDWFDKQPSSIPLRDNDKRQHTETKGRRNSFSHRRRWQHRRFPTGNDDYVHIVFHNKLSTLAEESWTKHLSGDDADTETLNSSGRRQRSHKLSSSGSIDEKFIIARWEYSLQIMRAGSFVNNGALIDARDEINDIMRPANSVPDDCSIELETGEI